MVKKVVTWIQFETPTTTFQVHKYIETCKDWLITPEKATTTEKIITTSNTIDCFDAQHCSNLGICGEKSINKHNECMCLICKSNTRVEDGKLICANPFTCASGSVVCNSCFQLV